MSLSKVTTIISNTATAKSHRAKTHKESDNKTDCKQDNSLLKSSKTLQLESWKTVFTLEKKDGSFETDCLTDNLYSVMFL